MTPRRAIETTNEETHTLAKHTLAPDELGPMVCVGEILVEIVGTTIGDGFWEAQPLVGPYPSGAENDRGSHRQFEEAGLSEAFTRVIGLVAPLDQEDVLIWRVMTQSLKAYRAACNLLLER